jgi:hypothetical protein
MQLKKQSVGAPWTSGVEGQVVWWTIFRILCNVIERQIRFRDTIGFFGSNYDRSFEKNACVTRPPKVTNNGHPTKQGLNCY